MSHAFRRSCRLAALSSMIGCSSSPANDLPGKDGGVERSRDGAAPRESSLADRTVEDRTVEDSAMARGPHDAGSRSDAGGKPVDAARDVGELSGSCATSPVFADDFSGASAPGGGYSTSGGTWVRSVGSYTVTSPNDANGPRGYALIGGGYASFDVTVHGHSIGGDGLGLVYGTTGAGDGYAVIVHPGEYHGVYFKRLVPGSNDVNIGSATLPTTIPPNAPFTLHVMRSAAGHVSITLTGSALGSAVTLSGDEQGAPTTGKLGLVWSPTNDGQGAVFTDFVVTSASCTSVGDASADARIDGGPDAGSSTALVPYSNGSSAPGPGPNNSNHLPWTLAFDDEFDGNRLDLSKWSTENGDQTNNVTTYTTNVAVSGGNLVLTLASSTSGAIVCSGVNCSGGGGSGAYQLPVGGYTEARVYFPGSGTTIYNWPAWWISGPNWPAAGENDIAEGLGTLTENYHSPSGTHNHGTVPGTWSNAFHVYGLYRMADTAAAYWDGKLVVSYSTDDNGQPQALLVNVGSANTGVYGTASQVLVDYVRAWQ